MAVAMAAGQGDYPLSLCGAVSNTVTSRPILENAMRPLLVVASLAAAALPLAAQQNPFEMPKLKLKGVQVEYQYGGDLPGTGEIALSGDRIMHRSSTTGKIFGKTATTNSWMLTTRDSVYTVDLTKKTGVQAPNPLPYLAKAYKDLDGTEKTRLHQNLQDMASLMSKAFGASVLSGGEKTGTKTYAGETCDERSFGDWTVCGMTKAPGVTLHSSGSIVCYNFEETATSVSIGEPPASAFEAPTGIVFSEDTNLSSPDSASRAFVRYLASQELSDSIAAARQKMAESKQTGASSGKPAEKMSKEDQQKACEAIRNFNLGKAVGNAFKNAAANAANAAVKGAEEGAKQSVTNKAKGLFKKPKFP
jgi:hypothetical protein